MTAVYLAPLPRCPDHGGPMRHDFAACAYVCRGWDGEGCPYRVTDEDLDWTYAGRTAGPVRWEPP